MRDCDFSAITAPVALGLANEAAERPWPVARSADRLAHINPEACQALWAAVVRQMWADAVAPTAVTLPSEILAAVRWFGSADFRLACEFAGVDDEAILRAFKEARSRQGRAQ